MPGIRSASVDGDTVAFRFPDPARRLQGVRLQQDVRIAGDRLELVRSQDHWVLTLPSRGLLHDVPAVLWSSAGLRHDIEAPLPERVATQLGDHDAVAHDRSCSWPGCRTPPRPDELLARARARGSVSVRR